MFFCRNFILQEAIAAIEVTSTPLSTPYNTDVISLEPSNDTDSDERTVTMVVYMPKSVGNKANYKKDAEVPTINLGLSNTINGTADRPFRFVISDPSATLIIKNNTVVSGGNSEGQLVKADGTVTVGNITLDENTRNGKSDSDVTAGMAGSDYIVK